MNRIIVIRGPLGVGKSTISKILSEKLNCEYFLLDQILKDNDLEGDDGIPVKNFIKANQLLLDLIRKVDKSCIIDGCFYYQEQIDDLKDKLDGNVIFLSLISSVEKCIERDAKRELVYGEDAARFVHMVSTKIKEGDEIDTTDLSVTETIDLIIKKLNED